MFVQWSGVFDPPWKEKKLDKPQEKAQKTLIPPFKM